MAGAGKGDKLAVFLLLTVISPPMVKLFLRFRLPDLGPGCGEHVTYPKFQNRRPDILKVQTWQDRDEEVAHVCGEK